MTVQDLLEMAVRKMVTDDLVGQVMRKDDGNAYAWTHGQHWTGLWILGFVDHDLQASVEDGFITVRRRSYLGVAGDEIDYRDLLVQNHKYPDDIYAVANIEGTSLLMATATNRLPLSIEPERLSGIIHLCCELPWPGVYNVRGLQPMPADLAEHVWEQRGFDLLGPH